jgi:hypothetical protein
MTNPNGLAPKRPAHNDTYALPVMVYWRVVGMPRSLMTGEWWDCDRGGFVSRQA